MLANSPPDIFIIAAKVSRQGRIASPFNSSIDDGVQDSFIQRIFITPTMTNWHFSSSQGCFLGVFPGFNKRTYGSMNHIPWSHFANQHSAMQPNLQLVVLHPDFKEVVSFCMWPLLFYICSDRVRHSKKLECLVYQVRAQIIQDTASRFRLFPPGIGTGFSPVSIIMRHELMDIPQKFFS